MVLLGAGAALTLALVQVAGAQEGAPPDDEKYTFFHQPDLARTQVLADWEECRDLASAVQPPRAGYIYSPNAIAAGMNGFMQGLQRGAQRRHLFDAALRKCMNLKGYARYAMAKDEAKALYDGGWARMREKLADRALAPVGNATRLEW